MAYSDDYYHRKCYLKNNQVPTQTVMINKMCPQLAKVYFKSMNAKLKKLAGLEPPMRGGGSDWFMPPTELLAGRAVLKPVKKEHISKFGFLGIDFLSYKLRSHHRAEIMEQQRKALEDNDLKWKTTILLECHKYWDELAKQAADFNTSTIRQAFSEFTSLYTTSLTNIETMLFQAAVKEINGTKEATYQKMKIHYEDLLQKQARMLYSRYARKLEDQKKKRRDDFILKVENLRADLGKELSEINYEKHVTLEKARNYLENQNFACQIYVALKEREECEKELNEKKEEHRRNIRLLKEEMAMQGLQIHEAKEREKKREEFERIWKKKVCHVIKTFQTFICYSLKSMPEYAEFFVNMEKLLLLQLSEAMENPEVESMIQSEESEFHTPVPKPHPYYLFCDQGFKPTIDEKLCPEHCTSSASQFPVIVVNKRYIYSACDNLSVFADKVEKFVLGARGDDADVEDDKNYDNYVPIKCTESQQLTELKLESSIMQILKTELPNYRNLPIYCCDCYLPHCLIPHSVIESYCRSRLQEPERLSHAEPPPPPEPYDPGALISSRSVELRHYREPKWESYINYVMPRECGCKKIAKKQLKDHMPPYMINRSKFETAPTLNYIKCPLEKLKLLVKEARQAPITPPPSEPQLESNLRNVSTQCVDLEYEEICKCFSDAGLKVFFQDIVKESISFCSDIQAKASSTSPVSTDFGKTKEFVTKQAKQLKRIITESSELEELFKRPDCDF